MAQAPVNGIHLEYELTGPEDGPVLLMIHGVGAQLIRWPKLLCDGLVEAGFRILRYDSRDIGLSTHCDGAPIPDLTEIDRVRKAGGEPQLPYSLADLAEDAAGLLDAFGMDAAHVLGVSLGGMVAQVLAVTHPRRVLSLNIMMSQAGNPDLLPSEAPALAILAKPAPDPAIDREAYLAHQIALNRALGSPDYPTAEAELRRFAEQAAERAYHPAGAARQLAAGRGAPDRRAALRDLSVPTLVIHGNEDPLIHPQGGEDIARNIRGAWLLKLNGMGHDLPEALFGLFVATILANCTRQANPSAIGAASA